MIASRRAFLRTLLHEVATSSAALVGLTSMPRFVLGRPAGVSPEPGKFRAGIGEELGGEEAEETDRITLNVPRVAEDGSAVPVTLESRIPATDRMVLFVERNPFPMVAAFQFDGQAEPFVSLHIKMNESSDVTVIARAGGRYYMTKKPVRVVIGGCG